MQRFTRAQHTNVTLSKILKSSPVNISKGIVPLRILNLFLTTPITRSTWIRTCAMWRLYSSSKGDNWGFPLVNAGIFTWAPRHPTLSRMSNPLSARIISPGLILFRNPECSVMYLSLVRPVHALLYMMWSLEGWCLLEILLCYDSYKKNKFHFVLWY